MAEFTKNLGSYESSIRSSYFKTITNQSDSISNICPNIPDYSIITNVILSFEWKTSVGGSNGDCQIVVNHKGEDYLTGGILYQIGSTYNASNSWKSVSVDKNTVIENHSSGADLGKRLTDYFNSGKANVGEYSGGQNFGIWFSASVIRKFSYRNLILKFIYTPPTYVISLSAGTGGTVSGAGTYDVGSTATIKAIPNTGYKFVKWSDGNTNAERQITITTSDISANVTNRSYTAYFEIDKIYVTYDSVFDFQRWANTNLKSWSLMDIYDVTDTEFTGTAVGDNDAFTQESRPLIPVEIGREYILEADVETTVGFQLFAFFCNADGAWGNFAYCINEKKLTFTPTTSWISIRCDIDGIGNVATFSNFRIYPADCPYMGSTVSAAERTDINAWSMPTPTREGYRFLGWFTQPNGGGTKYTSSSAFPTSDLVLYSHWEIQKHTATFKNHDGTVLQTISVESGGTPNYTGSTPTKPSTAEYSYSFSGWSPSIGAITSDTTYVAQFTAAKRKYTIATSGSNGSVTGGGTYQYGSSIILTANPNTGYKFTRWSDGNTSNPRTITVTGAATYTAIFEQMSRIILDEDRVKGFLLDENKVKGILIDNTKIY